MVKCKYSAKEQKGQEKKDSQDKLALIDGETLEDSLVKTEKLTLLDTLAEVPTERESKLTYGVYR